MNEILWYIAGVLVIAIGIGFSIGWHELGHLLPAKKFGVKVPRYMIGFGPTLFSRKRGETEYGVKAIPLGGYITMIGMYPPAAEGTRERKGSMGEAIAAARNAHSEYVTDNDAHRMFYQLPVLKRIIIMFGGPFMNLFLGVLLTAISVSGIGTFVRSTTVESISQCVPMSFENQVPCSLADADSPAKVAGLKAGDKVLKVDGQSVSSWDEIASFAATHPGELNLTVSSGGQTKDVSITPALVTRPMVQSDGSSKLQRVAFFGVVLTPVRQAQPLSAAFVSSGATIAQTFNLIFNLPNQVYQSVHDTFSGKPRSVSGAVSIIGVGQVAGEIGSNQQASFIDKLGGWLSMLASLNFALFAFNMIPLLPLDGGHIAGAIYEAIKKAIWRIRRKPNPGPADTALLMPMTYIVSATLIALSAVLLLLDLINPVKF
ncbi:MAG: hypothetical protein RLZZ164_580 [Actinomycetota bacterium]|jgi:membrane-associated protease RseP (regulator of RpoE activity)